MYNPRKESAAKFAEAYEIGTACDNYEDFLKEVSLLLVMSVNPGFGGQSFMEDSLSKLERLRSIVEKKSLNLDIEVDGGITLANVDSVLQAGANVIVAGTSVFQGDIKSNIKMFHDAMKACCRAPVQ